MRRNWVLIAWIVVPIALLGGLLIATLLQAPPRTEGTNDPKRTRTENELATVRSALAKQTDLATCKALIPRLNAHLRQARDHVVPRVAVDDMLKLLDELDIDYEEAEDILEEVFKDTFTPLDAHHLEACLLLRDVAASLEVIAPGAKGSAPPRLSPLERAEAGFAWVCRQVRLPELLIEPAPVSFVLRRGWGSAFERAVVFLALLEQFGMEEGDEAGLQGCLLGWMEDNRFRLWACGVAVGTKPDALYLFDPRVGLPIAGPGGKGIATLAQVQADPKLLTQFDADKLPYEVKGDELRKVEAFLITPLSSAAPRMMLLQNVLLRERTWEGKSLPSAIRVRLAETPRTALNTIQTAAGKVRAQFLTGGATLLRQALPSEEGGSDEGALVDVAQVPGFTTLRTMPVTLPRMNWFNLAAVPWRFFPEIFRDTTVYTLNAGIGRDLRQMFQTQFLRHFNDPSSAREMILRGRLSKVTSEQLAKERDQWQSMRHRSMPEKEMRTGIEAWKDRADKVYADVLTGRLAEGDARSAMAGLYRWKHGEPMEVLMSEAIGTPRAADLTYQLALCLHERAVRHQLRYQLAKRADVELPDELRRAEEAFSDAERCWKELIDLFPGSPYVPTARIFRGEALWELGPKEKQEAMSLWKDVSAPQPNAQKQGSLWRARRSMK